MSGNTHSEGIRKRTSERTQEEVFRGGGGEKVGKGTVVVWRSKFLDGRIQLCQRPLGS